jgi:sugar phosphate isomerase/epimerase
VRPKVALQLHSVREVLRYDPPGTLAAVAAAGFHYIELSAHDAEADAERVHRLRASEWRSLADDAGLVIVGGQVSNLAPANVARVADFYETVGAQHVTIPIGYYPDRAALDERARTYNHLGQVLASRGLNVLYLNHYHEFQVVDGETILDGLLARTDPRFMNLALSPYWLMRGLIDPVKTLRAYGSRIHLVEQADFPLAHVDKMNMWEFRRYHPIAANIRRDRPLRGGEIENIQPVQSDLFCEVGEGILKLQEVIDEANLAGGVRYVTLRQDFSRLPSELDSLRISAANYRRVRDVDWA